MAGPPSAASRTRSSSKVASGVCRKQARGWLSARRLDAALPDVRQRRQSFVAKES